MFIIYEVFSIFERILQIKTVIKKTNSVGFRSCNKKITLKSIFSPSKSILELLCHNLDINIK